MVWWYISVEEGGIVDCGCYDMEMTYRRRDKRFDYR